MCKEWVLLWNMFNLISKAFGLLRIWREKCPAHLYGIERSNAAERHHRPEIRQGKHEQNAPLPSGEWRKRRLKVKVWAKRRNASKVLSTCLWGDGFLAVDGVLFSKKWIKNYWESGRHRTHNRLGRSCKNALVALTWLKSEPWLYPGY